MRLLEEPRREERAIGAADDPGVPGASPRLATEVGRQSLGEAPSLLGQEFDRLPETRLEPRERLPWGVGDLERHARNRSEALDEVGQHRLGDVGGLLGAQGRQEARLHRPGDRLLGEQGRDAHAPHGSAEPGRPRAVGKRRGPPLVDLGRAGPAPRAGASPLGSGPSPRSGTATS